MPVGTDVTLSPSNNGQSEGHADRERKMREHDAEAARIRAASDSKCTALRDAALKNERRSAMNDVITACRVDGRVIDQAAETVAESLVARVKFDDQLNAIDTKTGRRFDARSAVADFINANPWCLRTAAGASGGGRDASHTTPPGAGAGPDVEALLADLDAMEEYKKHHPAEWASAWKSYMSEKMKPAWKR